MKTEISKFFHDFTLRILLAEHADPNNPRQVKEAMINHYEEIYPAFAQTEVFKRCYNQPDHDKMVEAYKENFTMLLCGKIPF